MVILGNNNKYYAAFQFSITTTTALNTQYQGLEAYNYVSSKIYAGFVVPATGYGTDTYSTRTYLPVYSVYKDSSNNISISILKNGQEASLAIGPTTFNTASVAVRSVLIN